MDYFTRKYSHTAIGVEGTFLIERIDIFFHSKSRLITLTCENNQLFISDDLQISFQLTSF